jgi:CheY-like chemotaxis protein
VSAEPWILVVDDDEDIRAVILLLLDMAGYAAVGAADGLEALERIQSRGRPALVLLDLRMPRLNGPGFVGALRADPALAAVPIVVLSGDAMASEIASSLGVSGCLKKPVDLEDLVGAVDRHCPAGAADPI